MTRKGGDGTRIHPQFGFWGIVIGPVLMILIVTTIEVYLAVYKGVETAEPDEEPKRRRKWWPRKAALAGSPTD